MYRVTLTDIGPDPMVTARALSDSVKVDMAKAYALILDAELPLVLLDGVNQESAERVKVALEKENSHADVSASTTAYPMVFSIPFTSARMAREALRPDPLLLSATQIIQVSILLVAYMLNSLLYLKVGMALIIVIGWFSFSLIPCPARTGIGRRLLITFLFCLNIIFAPNISSFMMMLFITVVSVEVIGAIGAGQLLRSEYSFPSVYLNSLGVFGLMHLREIAPYFCGFALLDFSLEYWRTRKNASKSIEKEKDAYGPFSVVAFEIDPDHRKVIKALERLEGFSFMGHTIVDSNLPTTIRCGLNQEEALSMRQSLDLAGVKTNIITSGTPNIMEPYEPHTMENEIKYSKSPIYNSITSSMKIPLRNFYTKYFPMPETWW